MYPDITPSQVGARLRSIRRARSLSLHEVENLSKGALKAVVLGSYERGSRNLTIKRALEIAKLYNIPISELFSEKAPVALGQVPRLMLDIRALNRSLTSGNDRDSLRQKLISQMLRRICEERQDWNGEVITLRDSDLGTISLILSMDKVTALEWLTDLSILLKRKDY